MCIGSQPWLGATQPARSSASRKVNDKNGGVLSSSKRSHAARSISCMPWWTRNSIMDGVLRYHAEAMALVPSLDLPPEEVRSLLEPLRNRFSVAIYNCQNAFAVGAIIRVAHSF